MTDSRTYSCWAMIYPTEEIDGQWTAHCLNFDLVAQADSPMEALRLVCEASCLVVEDDLQGGFDPSTRTAPEEDWERFYEKMNKASEMQVSKIVEEKRTMLMPFEIRSDAMSAHGQRGRDTNNVQAA